MISDLSLVIVVVSGLGFCFGVIASLFDCSGDDTHVFVLVTSIAVGIIGVILDYIDIGGYF